MVESLKTNAVPKLRDLGFQGSYPHFRRPLATRTDLITFQFDKYGGGFVVEISKAPPGDFTTSWGEIIPIKKLTASYLPPDERLRLGSKGVNSDYWFRYDRSPLFRKKPTFEELAKEVCDLIEVQAEPWWNDT